MKVIKGLVLLCLMMLAGCQSEEETSQFLLACKYDAPATIAAMLDNGIDVDGQDKTGLSGLMVAAAENRRDVVELLLKRRAKPNLQTRQGVTALMLAAARGGDTVTVTDTGALIINGSTVAEPDITTPTQPVEGGPDYPVTLAEDELFLLCDARTTGADSRLYGPIPQRKVLGTALAALRRSGL